MGQSCSKSHQLLSSSQLGAVDSSLSGKSSIRIIVSKRGFMVRKPSKKKTRRTAGGSVRLAILKRWVTCEEEDCHTRASSMEVSYDGQGPAAIVPSRHQSRCESNATSIAEFYRVLSQVVGAGVAGKVRLCIHLPTSDLRAVKTIAKRGIRRHDRLWREVAFLGEVDHPNIVSLRDAYEDADAVHIVTELCRGGGLFDKIMEKSRRSRSHRSLGGTAPACFCEEDAARILRGLLLAVAYLHARDIVHRDIKPENILFAEQDDSGGDAPPTSSVRLIDFGLAVRHPTGRWPLSAVVGTAYYMAPEVLAGEYSRACDLWSVGVIAYVMLAGRSPFKGLTNDDIFDRIREGRYRMEGCALWRGVSESAREFVRGLLVTNPARRWTADTALKHPWLKVGSGR